MTATPTSSVQPSPQSFWRRNWWVIAGLVIAAAVVVFLAPAASSNPDGLDRVSGDREFADRAEEPRYEWLPDYSVPGVDSEWASVVLAGLVGVGVVFAVTTGLGFMAKRAKGSST